MKERTSQPMFEAGFAFGSRHITTDLYRLALVNVE